MCGEALSQNDFRLILLPKETFNRAIEVLEADTKFLLR